MFPATADVDRLAYFFIADYDSGSHARREPIEALSRTVRHWHERWAEGSRAAPVLRVRQVSSVIEGNYLLFDSRDRTGDQEVLSLNRPQAAAALTVQPYTDTETTRWALEHKVAIVIDSHLVGLATAEPSMLQEFEAEHVRASRKKVPKTVL